MWWRAGSAGRVGLAVYAVEALARPGSDLVAAIRRQRPELAQVEPEEVRSAAGLRAVAFVQPKLDPSRQAVAVATTYTVLPDDTRANA